MKKLKSFMLLVGILLGSTVFYSCLDDDDAYSEYWKDSLQAIVTVKPLSDNSYYMQLDDTTTLFPTNTYTPKNLKETRAFVVYKNDDKKTEGYDYSVQLLRMDTLLTKPIASDLGTENDSYYGTDMLALNGRSIWAKNGVWIEDGYITFDFFVNVGERHFLNLVQVNAVDPYELEFRHKAEGGSYMYDPLQGLVSFKLDKLPDTEGKTVKLKIRYKSFASNDYRTIELDYKSKDTEDTEK